LRFETNSKEERDWKTFDTDKHLRVEEHYGENLNQRRDYPRRQSKAGQRSGLSFLVNPEPDEYYCSGNSAFGFRVELLFSTLLIGCNYLSWIS